jgi:hypothetical protein
MRGVVGLRLTIVAVVGHLCLVVVHNHLVVVHRRLLLVHHHRVVLEDTHRGLKGMRKRLLRKKSSIATIGVAKS